MQFLRDYILSVIEGNENKLSHLTGEINNNLDLLVNKIINEKSVEKIDDQTLKNRISLSNKCYEFHQKARTLTNEVLDLLDKIKDPKTILLEGAHQPNFLPYVGYIQKIFIMHLLSEKLTKKGFVVVQMFGLLDTDTVRNRWTRSSIIRDFMRKDNRLFLRYKPDNKKLGFNFNPAPTNEQVDLWKCDLDQWLKSNALAVNKISRKTGKENAISYSSMKEFNNNLDFIFKLIDDTEASTYGEYNSIVISKMVNLGFQFPTLFYTYSSSMNLLENIFSDIMNNQKQYVTSHNKYLEELKSTVKISKEDYVKEIDHAHTPFRYQCDCGSPVFLMIDNNSLIGRCEMGYTNCQKKYNFDFKTFFKQESSKVIPRAVFRNLTMFNLTKPKIYVSGWGAMPFTLVGRGVSKDLSYYYPTILNFDNFNMDNPFIRYFRSSLNANSESFDKIVPSFLETVITNGFPSVLKKWKENYTQGLIKINC
jgi:hypothetical protein